MTGEELAAIEARVQAATPEPWNVDTRGGAIAGRGLQYGVEWGLRDANNCYLTKYGQDADLEFIAHAREDVPALLAEVRRLRKEVADLLDTHCPGCECADRA